MTDSAPPQLSVVIPTYQRRDSVLRALAALQRQSLPAAQFEVIVIVDGSIDGTASAVAGLAMPFELRVVEQANRGRAAACNSGIRQARGEWIVLLDDDMEPLPDCLSLHLAAHTRGACLGIVGAVPIAADAQPTLVRHHQAPRFAAHLARLERHGRGFPLEDFFSGHFSIRRQCLLDVGLFDESFKKYGNEDLDLAVRLHAAGVSLDYAPNIVARQHYLKTFRQLAHDTASEGQTAVQLARKYPGMVAHLRLGAYERVSLIWRLGRWVLLALTTRWPATLRALIGVVEGVERLDPPGLGLLYRFVLDVHYWAGVRACAAAPGEIDRLVARSGIP